MRGNSKQIGADIGSRPLALFASLAYIAAVKQETLGQAIRRLRLEAGYGLREFAGLIGISAAYQSDIEHDRRTPTDDVLRETAKVLGRRVTITYEALRAISPRLDADVRELLQQSPEANQLLREVKQTGRPVSEVIRQLQEHLRKTESESEDA